MLPEVEYKIRCEDSRRGYGYLDYEKTIFLGIPKYTHERSINHEFLHHAYYHLQDGGIRFCSAMRFDLLGDFIYPEEWDLRWMFESGLPAFKTKNYDVLHEYREEIHSSKPKVNEVKT